MSACRQCQTYCNQESSFTHPHYEVVWHMRPTSFPGSLFFPPKAREKRDPGNEVDTRRRESCAAQTSSHNGNNDHLHSIIQSM